MERFMITVVWQTQDVSIGIRSSLQLHSDCQPVLTGSAEIAVVIDALI